MFRLVADFLFLFLFLILVAVWLIAWAAFHVAGGMIHFVLVIAVICLIVHLLRGPRRA